MTIPKPVFCGLCNSCGKQTLHFPYILPLENTVMDGDFALWGSMLETDLIENDKIDQLKEIGGIRSQNLLSFCTLFIFYLLQWSRARVCWVTDSVHMGFTITTLGHSVPGIQITAEAWLHMGTQQLFMFQYKQKC